jgi:hypothetical protein
LVALLFLDGFDHYASAQLPLKWTSLPNGATSIDVTAGQGRRGTASLRVSPSANRSLMKQFSNQATWIVGVAFRTQTYPSGATEILGIYDSGAQQVNVVLNSTGTLSVRRGTTVLLTGSTVVTLNVYVSLELLVTIDNAAGTYTLRVNGATEVTQSGLDTQATANAFGNQVRIGTQPAGPVVDFDDVYVCDATGAAPHNTFLGDCRVDTLLPNAEGATQQWTPSTGTTHYALVDETPPNTTDYVASFTPPQRDLFGMQDLSTMTGTIYGVQLALAALKSDAGARSLRGVIRSGASEALGSMVALGTSQTYTLQVQTTDPATGTAWTESGVNSVQVGAEVA